MLNHVDYDIPRKQKYICNRIKKKKYLTFVSCHDFPNVPKMVDLPLLGLMMLNYVVESKDLYHVRDELLVPLPRHQVFFKYT